MSTQHTAKLKQARGKQQGAAFMVMLVIMAIGAVTIFVNSLNSSAQKIARDQITADVLAQAKEALIGRAVADAESPGSLPCPDTDNDGDAESPVGQTGSNCPSYIGRLPWKTLGLPDLRDSAGESLWYVLSPNFRDFVSLNPINSNSVGTLTVSGTIPVSNVAAIVFAAESALSGQSRSSTNTATCLTTTTSILESRCATNYLESSNPAVNLQLNPNLNYQSADTGSTFNDRLMIIKTQDIMSVVELRVQKELNKAFASYTLASTGNKYPYPANFTTTCTTTSCPSDALQCIGKLPATDLNLYAMLPSPWITNNKWFDVVYYTAGTASLPGGAGGGGGGGGKGGKGKKGGGGGGGSPGTVGNTLCAGTPTTLTVNNIDGSIFTSTASALFILPGTPLAGVPRTSMSSTSLAGYFEDAVNTDINTIYQFPGDSNDFLYILP